MIKLVYCLRRKPGMTWDEFSTYWREVHAPLVAARAEALGIRRYVQVRTADAPAVHAAMQARNGGSPEPFDGVAELWFDDDALTRAPTPESAKAGPGAARGRTELHRPGQLPDLVRRGVAGRLTATGEPSRSSCVPRE